MAQTTANFGFNIAEGTDVVNLLTQCYPNFTSLDSILQGIKETGVTVATDTKVGTVHQLVRTDTDCNMFRFIATGNYASGDTFTVDGNAVTATAMDGTSLPAGAFVINQSVVGILNGLVLTIVGVTGASSVAAEDVTYDNTDSGLTATDVQDAIDEVLGDIPANAAALSYDNTVSGLTATDVQAAIDELKTLIPSEPAYITTGLSIIGGKCAIVSGGYYIDNGYVYVKITVTTLTTLSGMTDLITGFPAAASYNTNAPYNITPIVNALCISKSSGAGNTLLYSPYTKNAGETYTFEGSYQM